MREAEDNLFDCDGRKIEFVLQLVVNLLIGCAAFDELIKTVEDSLVAAFTKIFVSLHSVNNLKFILLFCYAFLKGAQK